MTRYVKKYKIFKDKYNIRSRKYLKINSIKYIINHKCYK